MRWARAQDRLALSDISDERIPRGGTPGFMVIDGRVGWRFARHAAVHTVFENLTDEAYRYHGSSVNGPGRSFTMQMELGL
jgi:iron complex outermembrane receptor protein/hemoglobin/transferrin/lactoferrin receptor protein